VVEVTGDEITSIAVIGAGTMGSQIAQQFGLYGFSVKLYDIEGTQLDRARQQNYDLLKRRVEKGTLSQEAFEQAIKNVEYTKDLEDACKQAELVIEAVIEDLETKRKVFAQVDKLCPPETILATNSSTIVISMLYDSTSRPEKCCNMHFFHPVLVMELCEIVKGPKTSDQTVEIARRVVERAGKVPVVLQKEIDGFIVNRILHAATQEAYMLYHMGVADYKDIDIAVEKGLHWPMGPFRLGDLTGLDVTYKARLYMYEKTGDPRFKPTPELEAKVKAGELGRKTKRGWYTYD